MKIYLVCTLFLFTMCNSDQLPAQNFTGNFNGENNGIISSISLKVNNKQLTGPLVMNGQAGQLTGIIKNDSTTSGTIYDTEMQKNYDYTGKISGNTLTISIVFPELNNQAVELIMQRKDVSSSTTKTNGSTKTSGAKNPLLIGVWRYTEVLSSGGNGYASLSTEYFMEFKSDGTFLSWTGRSAGTGYSNNGGSRESADKGDWYTEGKNLYLIDPKTNQKVSTLFFAEANRMMLHDGGNEKKIYEKVE